MQVCFRSLTRLAGKKGTPISKPMLLFQRGSFSSQAGGEEQRGNRVTEVHVESGSFVGQHQ